MLTREQIFDVIQGYVDRARTGSKKALAEIGVEEGRPELPLRLKWVMNDRATSVSRKVAAEIILIELQQELARIDMSENN